jgi:uncharacterized protein (DUF697 family)/tellurite resistance protein
LSPSEILWAHRVLQCAFKGEYLIMNKAYEAVSTLGLMAAFADGKNDDAERERLKEIFQSFGPVGPDAYRRILMRETTVEQEAAHLDTPELRTLAFEMAVAVCDADGVTSPGESAFLKELGAALELPESECRQVETQANALAAAPVDLAPAELQLDAGGPPAGSMATAAVDGMILKYAMLNGALELLPQSLATMAILPLQMKMVYGIGKHYGVALDSGHIKEFLAVAGVGLSSQTFENFARKFLGSVAKKTVGKQFGRLAKGAVGPALTFGTTYAIGQVAKSYYGGGRRLSSAELRTQFQQLLGQGQQLYGQHATAIASQSQNLDLGSVMKMVRGGV